MMSHMADTPPVKRLTESIPGKLAGCVLALLWIYSLSGVDSRAFSAYPVCVGLCVVAGIVIVALLLGYRVVRMSMLGWLSLATGGYFLARCLCSYAVVESWGESALIVGAAAYYVAGVYVAQNRSYRSVFVVLGGAVLLSIVAWWAVKQPWFCLEWTGRATYTPEGKNNLPTALLIYKNFAGFFFIAGGVALGAWCLWNRKSAWSVVPALLAVSAVVVSFLCNTRAPFFLVPIALFLLWVFDLLVQLYSGRRIGVLSYVIGAISVVLLCVGSYDFFFGNALSGFFNEVDSHDRYRIWASVCEGIQHAPLWGFGAGAAEWEVIPYFDGWSLPNYAHNEYLQVWLDYGILGVLLVLFVIVSHVVRGFLCVASDKVSQERRAFVAVSIMLLLFVSAYASSDFPWHSFSLVTMCAFVCGILASPFPYTRNDRRWAAGSHVPVVGVKAESWVGRAALLCVMGGIVYWGCVMGNKLHPAWLAQWEYNQLSQPEVDGYAHQRRALIARILPSYPDSALMDTYYKLPHYQSDWKERERLLKLTLEANPKQLFVVAMLVDALGRQHQFAEAEQLMREYYIGDAMPGTCLTNWPAFYAYNLLEWGRDDMANQRNGLALSKMEYALAIHGWKRVNFDLLYRRGDYPWRKRGGMKPWLNDMIRGCRRDVQLLRLLGTEPDDSWRQPLVPGGRPALYSSIVDKK